MRPRVACLLFSNQQPPTGAPNDGAFGAGPQKAQILLQVDLRRADRPTRRMTEAAMMRITFAALAIAASAGVALAAVSGAEAIKERRALMKHDGEVTKPLVPMLRGKSPFDLATVQKALRTYENAAEKEPALFPPDSKTGDTHALPAIWEDDNLADLDARFKKFGEDAKAALASIKDEASFKATMPGVLNNCDGCHEKYHTKQQ